MDTSTCLSPEKFLIAYGAHPDKLLEVDDFSLGFGDDLAGLICPQPVANSLATLLLCLPVSSVFCYQPSLGAKKVPWQVAK